MFRVVSENPVTFAIEKVSEHATIEDAKNDIRAMIENGSERAFWIINTDTGEIL